MNQLLDSRSVRAVRMAELCSKASLHAVGLVVLSVVGGVLFMVAQENVVVGPSDHRHLDAFILWAGLLFLTWVIATIFEYRWLRTYVRPGTKC